MNTFDSSQKQQDFNFLFLLCAVLLTATAFVWVWCIHQWYGALTDGIGQSQARTESFMRNIKYQDVSCDSSSYSNDLLLRKITNSNKPISASYVPDSLVEVSRVYTHPRVGTQQVRQDVVQPLIDLIKAARSQGIDLRLNSGYRSYDRQNSIYTSYSDALLITKPERAARAGYSEHQLGSTVDVSHYPSNSQRGYDWLRNNAYKYGFALSYPKGSEAVTEFMYEPWHWRFVGVEIADYIHRKQALFNHQKGLLLPSPIVPRQELSYEYLGNDLWVWKSNTHDLDVLVRGQEGVVFETDILGLLSGFDEGWAQNHLGKQSLLVRDWIQEQSSVRYFDKQGSQWIRTSYASPTESGVIERLEILYRPDFGYLVIGHQEQQSADRLVKEFTNSCTVD